MAAYGPTRKNSPIAYVSTISAVFWTPSITAKATPEISQPMTIVFLRPIRSPSQPWKTYPKYAPRLMITSIQNAVLGGELLGLGTSALRLEPVHLLVQLELRALPQLPADDDDQDDRGDARHQVHAAPPDDVEQQQRQRAGDEEAERPAALDDAVPEPAVALLPLVLGQGEDLVEVGGVHRLLGEAQAAQGAHHDGRPRRQRSGTGRDDGRQRGGDGGAADGGHHPAPPSQAVDDGPDAEGHDRRTDGDEGVHEVRPLGGPAEVLLHRRQQRAEQPVVEDRDRPGGQGQPHRHVGLTPGERREPAADQLRGLDEFVLGVVA